MTNRVKSLELQRLARTAAMPEGKPATDKVLYRWHNEVPDRKIVEEALLCMEQGLPFLAFDRQWRVTYCEIDETDCFAIEGVEWK
ncbi:hypothetical protein RB623_25510 [Mesorhizobium sp. LHD-90]|uniref:hypothetical protein n=1 Tax=Mesorhizobium sp. LHD-90 TaxID=3071414 RepID=UPI0027DFD709|nr:hypothetical protein [Mesorhizobium sp. LHD-90]MDQ6437425.1 hypothetical protein [Mesorhizobium sp. LHD-90]